MRVNNASGRELNHLIVHKSNIYQTNFLFKGQRKQQLDLNPDSDGTATLAFTWATVLSTQQRLAAAF